MLDVLSASTLSSRLTPGRFLLVAGFHGMLLVAAARPVARTVATRARQIVLEPFVPVATPARPAAAEARSDDGAIEATPLVSFDAPLTGVSTPDLPVLAGPSLDPVALRRFLPGGLGDPAGSGGGGDAVLAAAEVDDPAAVIQQPAPRYPPVLRQAGIEGRVLLEFVIDSAGHVEPGSLRVLERSRPGFDAAAEETILHSLFRPARVRGRAVRQRTWQAIAFRIG
jgi:TonB family protein